MLRTLILLPLIATVAACAHQAPQPPARAAADGSIIDKDWVVASINGSDAHKERPATFRMAADGKAKGTTGCTPYYGSGKIFGAREIWFGAIGVEKVSCAADVRAQEHALIRALLTAESYTVGPSGELEIYSEGYKSPMRLRPAAY